eukprot:g18273.t1
MGGPNKGKGAGVRKQDYKQKWNNWSGGRGGWNNWKNNQKNNYGASAWTWEQKVSRRLTKWLRYDMRSDHPDNASNWVFWKAVPGAEVEFTEAQLEQVCKSDPERLESWWEMGKKDEEGGTSSNTNHVSGLYIRSTRKNKIASDGDDVSYWVGKDIAAIAARNKELYETEGKKSNFGNAQKEAMADDEEGSGNDDDEMKDVESCSHQAGGGKGWGAVSFL